MKKVFFVILFLFIFIKGGFADLKINIGPAISSDFKMDVGSSAFSTILDSSALDIKAKKKTPIYLNFDVEYLFDINQNFDFGFAWNIQTPYTIYGTDIGLMALYSDIQLKIPFSNYGDISDCLYLSNKFGISFPYVGGDFISGGTYWGIGVGSNISNFNIEFSYNENRLGSANFAILDSSLALASITVKQTSYKLKIGYILRF